MNTNCMKKQKGLSLIELMIAVVLGIFITGGMIQLFVNSKQSYRVQESLSRVQENGRFAIDFINKDLRVADYWGCLNGATSIESNLNANATYDNFANAIAGTNDDGINNSDSITISGVASSGIFVVDIPASPSADLKVTNNSGLKENDIVIVSDCTAGDIFQITNDPSAGGTASFDNTVHNTGNVSSGPGNADKILQKIYGTDAQIYKFHSVKYEIKTGEGNQPALFRSINGASAHELVEGIENMQILYGVDTDGDNTANFYASSNALSAAQMELVKSIRVTLAAISLEDNLATNPVSYTLVAGATPVTPTDHKIRRVFTSTIAVRNRLL